MTTSTKRPNTISQTTGSYATGKYYRAWSNLSNLKTEANFADCGGSGSYIGGKNGTYPRPAPLKLTNFKFNIPSTAKISKITVYYRHYKPKISGAYPSFNAPTIDLLNVSATAKKGSAVPTSSTQYSVSWSISPSVSKVNSSSFGVSINYPANSNTNPGQLRLRNVHIVVTYTNAVSSSSSSSSSSSNGYYWVNSDGSITYVEGDISQIQNISTNSGINNNSNVSGVGSNISKSKVYSGETADITLTISTSSKITALTRMYIALPSGVEYVGKKSGNGSIGNEISTSLHYQGNENYYWQANFSNSNQASITFTVRIITIGTKTLTFREETTDKSTSVKITCEAPPMPLIWEVFKDMITVGENAEFSLICTNVIDFSSTAPIEKTFTVTFPVDATVTWDNSDFTVEQNNNVHTITKTIEDNESHFPFTLSLPDTGKYTIIVEDESVFTNTGTIIVKPSNLTLPYFCKIVADEHVRDRLGNSKEYTLSSLMQLVVGPGNESLIEDYDYNYRLGVFNTALPTEFAPWVAFTQNEEATITQSSASNNVGRRKHDVFLETTDDVHVSMLMKQTSIGRWWRGGLSICTEEPSITTTTNDPSNGGDVIVCAGTGTVGASTTYAYFQLFDQRQNEHIILDRYYLFEVIRTGNTFYAKITDTTTGDVVVESIKTVENAQDYKYWTFYAFEGCIVSYKEVNILKSTSENYIFENAEWSDPISSANTWEDIQVNFFYSEEYPLIFLITGEYIEANAEEIDIQYTYPCLIEEDYRELAENPGLFEYPIKGIITDEGVSSLELQPGEVTNVAKLYDIDFTNFLESDDDNRIIQGVTVYFDVLTCDNPISIMAKLSSPSFSKEGSRSLNIESIFLENEIFQGVVSIGGEFDLWGLDWDDFKLSKLEDLEIDLQFLNNFNQAAHIEFNNLRIVFHYVELEESKIISKVNGVDLRYFNVFIKDAIIKPGSNYEVQYLDVEGTDSNLAYRSNLREKEIEMEIRVPGCDIEETTTFVERLSRILTTKRDKFNKPILNEIEFSHHPNRIWKYILEDELDLSAEFTEYEGKIKLVVPSGTAFSKEPTITNATGTNGGIAKVNPIIRVIAQPDENGNTIIVKETISNQEWRLTDDSLEIGDIIRIDCGERKAYKVEGQDDDYYENDSDGSPDIDITDKVDFNSDWFLIQDDYNFECENTAIIQSVTFYERW